MSAASKQNGPRVLAKIKPVAVAHDVKSLRAALAREQQRSALLERRVELAEESARRALKLAAPGRRTSG